MRKSKKVKNFILKTVTWFMGTVWILSALSIDSPTWTPTITLIISGAWLALFGLANGWFEIIKERWDA